MKKMFLKSRRIFLGLASYGNMTMPKMLSTSRYLFLPYNHFTII